MPEATNDEELQAKLKKICDKQDAFKMQKDKERVERSKGTGTGTKSYESFEDHLQGSKQKAVSEDDNDEAEARRKRARTAVNNTGGSGGRILEVHYCLGELEKQAGNWAGEVKEVRDEVKEDKEEVEEVREDVEEVHEEIEEIREEIKGPHEEGKESHKVDNNETMKDPEGNEL
ncbi:hypothetical protein M422DRAFT_250662 [Sphaerobolus stellatus SS14]|uniref:Uncharacterized protein n=1 Tax=Sphaerobolus stellatus (strain SS14) TaxID=990650 RepID=A0A0C9VTG7_SPHS4|nr:hypothetical protein M422DRAFT_250662 [Sphaerobolus stellatus SS14]